MRYTLIATVVILLVLTACEGKKSLDGYPMDKPPPSAYGPRDSEPVIAKPVVVEEEDEVVEARIDDLEEVEEIEVEAVDVDESDEEDETDSDEE